MKIPVLVRRWRDTRKLIAIFITSPYETSPTKCWAYEMSKSLDWCSTISVLNRTTRISNAIAEEFVKCFDTPTYKKAIGEDPQSKFEIHQRYRPVTDSLARKQKLLEKLNGKPEASHSPG